MYGANYSSTVIEFGDSMTYHRLINTGTPVVSCPSRILSETVTFMSGYQNCEVVPYGTLRKAVALSAPVPAPKLCAALGQDKATSCGITGLSYVLEASAR